MAEETAYIDESSNTYRVETEDVPYLHRELENIEDRPTPDEEREIIKRMLQNNGPMTRPEIKEQLAEELEYNLDKSQINTRMRWDDRFEHKGKGYVYEEPSFNPLE